jgi:hypothetical protein
VFRTFAAQVVARKASQLAVDQRHQLFERCLIAFTPVDQELRYAFGGPHMCSRQSLQQIILAR